ncbi:alpha-glucosidase [Dermatophilaceae bacterium Soc4.6]
MDTRPDWWTSAVVYQVYPRSFADSDGDGVGDLPGVTARLDHLGRLGIDVLWLSPVYRSPMDDNGYDISDYQDIDPIFGTLADIDALIAGCHDRGIRLVMDLVVNHTSDEHPWFTASRSSADDPRRDWYWWRPPRPGHEPGTPGAEPTNWEAAFSGPAWHYDESTGEYYLHLFSRKQPDLNWENPQVRQAVYAMMRWWVDRGVDGFRMDVINLISKDPALPDTPPAADTGLGAPTPAFNGPRLEDYLQEMNREVGLSDRHLLTVGEMPGSTVDLARRVTDPSRRELTMVFTFEHVDLDVVPGGTKWDLAPLRLPTLKRNLETWQVGLADVGWNSLYWNNHDQPRAVSRFGDDRAAHRVASAKTLGTVLHLHRGTPYVYQGEELGMTNSPFASIDDYRDIESVNHYADAASRGEDLTVVLRSLAARSRDHARTPMQWDDSPHAGFTTGQPWLPTNPAHTEINAAAQVDDPESVFAHYRALIALRHDRVCVRDGRFTLLLPDHEQLWVIRRDHAEETLLVLANCSSERATLATHDLPDLEGSTVLLATHPDRSGSPATHLLPWESRILHLAR